MMASTHILARRVPNGCNAIWGVFDLDYAYWNGRQKNKKQTQRFESNLANSDGLVYFCCRYEPPEDVPENTIFFRYNKFQHNARMAVMLLPCIGILAIFGGKA